jgi:hypothetical protein
VQGPVESEQDILAWALETSRRSGDPSPSLIQHAITTRASAAAALGWGTDDETPVYVIVIRGAYSVRRGARNPRRPDAPATYVTVPILFRVVEIKTGRVVDSGAKREMPDLTSLAPITTDLNAPR